MISLEDLGRNDDVRALPLELPNRVSHVLLDMAVRVDLDIVEEDHIMVATTQE